jgi:hypothetical protein
MVVMVGAKSKEKCSGRVTEGQLGPSQQRMHWFIVISALSETKSTLV